MTRLMFWFREQSALARHLEEAHRALKIAHGQNVALQQRVADLEADLGDAQMVSRCCGRTEHVRLAHRLQIAETQIAEGLGNVRWLPVPLFTIEPRGGDLA